MITGYALALVLCGLLIGLLFYLLRTRRIREKYAGIWIVVSLGVLVLAIVPKLAFWLSEVTRVNTPVNLLFAVSVAVLLAVCIQLSTEVTALEEETRTIAEEFALLRQEVRAAQEHTGPAPQQPVLPVEGAPLPRHGAFHGPGTPAFHGASASVAPDTPDATSTPGPAN